MNISFLFKVAFVTATALLCIEPVRAHHENGLHESAYSDRALLAEEKRLNVEIASLERKKGQFSPRAKINLSSLPPT